MPPVSSDDSGRVHGRAFGHGELLEEPIAAVFWDIGGVILDLESVEHAHALFVDLLCDRHELSIQRDRALEVWRTAVGDAFRSREPDTYYPARAAYAAGVAAVIEAANSSSRPASPNHPDREAWQPLLEAATCWAIEPNPGAVETVHELVTRDLHVGILSDVDDAECRLILERFGIRDAFDSITTSEAVGHTKPHPAMFETALEAAGLRDDPERALMIGDRYDHDIVGAADAGMVPVGYGADTGAKPMVTIDRLPAVLDVLDVGPTQDLEDCNDPR